MHRLIELPERMQAIVTTGNGGYDKLELRQVPVPVPDPGEMLLEVLAAGVNNTEINTRLGWYSSSVEGGTEDTAAVQHDDATQKDDGGWDGATPFPLIQGTDCCGRIVVTEDASLLGQRAIVRACVRLGGFDDPSNRWMGSNFDGAFAQFVKVPASEVFPVDCSWSDAELATIPCAYGTAETMLERTHVEAGDTVLVPGASGGVGSATVQLAKRRGAYVIALAGPSKLEAVRALGADEVHARDADLLEVLGERSVDVAIDNVAGPGFAVILKLLKPGGRYGSSGAIAGPMVQLDMRDMYLKDITLYGSTGWDAPVFPNLIRYIEAGSLLPLVAATYPLNQIAEAQDAFLKKAHVGNFVLIPPRV